MYKIYKYTNINNGKVYIGQTKTSLEKRAKSNGSNYCESPRFYNAIKKYGWDSFKPEILEYVDTLEDANDREIYYINKYNSTDINYGYNLSDGGGQPSRTEETKLKMSAIMKKRFSDPRNNPMYGKKHTEETLAKQRNKKLGKNNPMYGKPASEESNQKRRMSMTGKKIILSDEAKQKARERGRWLGNLRKKPVLCIEDGLEFESATTAAAHYGVTSSTLCGHLTGKQHTCCGKHFKYLDKNE